MSSEYQQPVKSFLQTLQWKNNDFKRLNDENVYLRSLKQKNIPKYVVEEQMLRQLKETDEDEDEEDVAIAHLNKGARDVHNEIVDSILRNTIKRDSIISEDLESEDGDENKKEKDNNKSNDNNSDEDEGDNEDNPMDDFSSTHRKQPTVNFTSIVTRVNFTFITLSIEVSKPSLVWCDATDRGKELIASVVRSSRDGTPVKRM